MRGALPRAFGRRKKGESSLWAVCNAKCYAKKKYIGKRSKGLSTCVRQGQVTAMGESIKLEMT